MHPIDRQTDGQTELLLLAPCAEFEATFKFPFKIGSRHSRLQTRANLTKPTAVTILLTHMACMAYTHLHTHTHAGYTLEQLSAVTDRERERVLCLASASFDLPSLLALFGCVELGIKLSAPF